MSYVKGYSHCNRCGGFFKVETLGDAGACNDRAWCDGVILHRAEILAEFAELQERAAGFAGIEAGGEGVPDGYHVEADTSVLAAAKKASRHAARAVDKCLQCGKVIDRPESKQRVRRSSFCYAADGGRNSACRNRWYTQKRSQRVVGGTSVPCGVCGAEIQIPADYVGRPPRYCFGTGGKRSKCGNKAQAAAKKARAAKGAAR